MVNSVPPNRCRVEGEFMSIPKSGLSLAAITAIAGAVAPFAAGSGQAAAAASSDSVPSKTPQPAVGGASPATCSNGRLVYSRNMTDFTAGHPAGVAYLYYDQCTQQTWAKVKANYKASYTVYLKSGTYPHGTKVEQSVKTYGPGTYATPRFNDAGKVSYALASANAGSFSGHTPSY